MKESLRETSLLVIVGLILITAISAAKIIGDQVTEYQDFKTLHSISKLSRPIHSLINELQVERTLAARYLSVKSGDLLPAVSQQYQQTDIQMGKFGQELKLTELLLLSIPEAELSEKVRSLKAERDRLGDATQIFYKHFVFYNRLIDELMSFQDKMFTYADGEEYKPVIRDLIHAESLKESIAQEQAFVAYHLTPAVIKLGEFPLILQEISNQNIQDLNLQSSEDPEIRSQVNQFFSSPEYNDLLNLRKQFVMEKPDLKGSVARGEEYIKSTSQVLGLLRNFNNGIQVRLENLARTEKARLKSAIIMTTIISIVVLLLLVGCHVWIRNVTSPLDSAQS